MYQLGTFDETWSIDTGRHKLVVPTKYVLSRTYSQIDHYLMIKINIDNKNCQAYSGKYNFRGFIHFSNHINLDTLNDVFQVQERKFLPSEKVPGAFEYFLRAGDYKSGMFENKFVFAKMVPGKGRIFYACSGVMSRGFEFCEVSAWLAVNELSLDLVAQSIPPAAVDRIFNECVMPIVSAWVEKKGVGKQGK
ncbi:MAG: hypothetical protein KIT16_15450 [Rhodospirillaceae bacterium]|nr:hypothetical protein [Rhodospirillaceae bacterium]